MATLWKETQTSTSLHFFLHYCDRGYLFPLLPLKVIAQQNPRLQT